MNLWRIIKVQAALALFVVAAFTQLAHAGASAQLPRNEQSAASFYSQRALDAMGARGKAMAAHYNHEAATSATTFDPGVIFPNGDPSSPGYVPGAPAYSTGIDFVPGVSDYPTAVTDSPARPDDREGVRGIGGQPSIVTTSASFDWNDAGIGALGALGTCLLLVGCGLFAASHRKHKPAVL